MSPSTGVRAVVWLFLSAGMIATVAAGWPGAILPDMATTLTEGQHFVFYGGQSPMFSLAWSLPLSVLPVPAAVGIGYVLQALAYWSIFALFAHAALQRGRPILGLLALTVVDLSLATRRARSLEIKYGNE